MIKKRTAESRQAHLEKFDRSSLIKKYITFSVLLFFVILIIGTTFFILGMGKILLKNKQVELKQLLNKKQIQAMSHVRSEIAVARRLANSPFIKRYFINPRDIEAKQLVDAEIESFLKDSTFNGSIFWVNDKDKIFHFDDDKSYRIDVKDKENYWYQLTMYETDDYNLNINYNREMDQTRLWINVPVRDLNGKSIGMVGTGVDLTKFLNSLYNDDDNDTLFYFFNDRGEITSAKDNSILLRGKKNINEELRDLDVGIDANIVKMAMKLQKNGEIYENSIRNVAYAIISMPDVKWFGFATKKLSYEDYYHDNPITRLFFVIYLIIFMMFIVANLIIIRFINSIHMTMESLRFASKTKSDFLARMSHEIRTPMNAIMGMAELALNEELPNEAKANVQTIKQAGNNLLAIINDILDFSKIETGKLEIVPSNYLLSSLVNDVISIIRIRAVDSKIRFVVNIDCNIPNGLFGDEIKIRQIMLNILNNAVKYTDSGHVSFTVIGEKANENTVVMTIVVEDSGKGIKTEDVGKIFDSFTQIDLEKNKGIEGTGLGLPIARSLIKAMEGDIEVYSEYGVGSTFTITLPQKIHDPTPLASVDNPSEKSVLVYETREIFSESIVCTIDNLGVSCTLVFSDHEFHENLATGKYPFAFVASTHYERLKTVCSKFKDSVNIILLADFGEIITDHNLSVVTMPVNSLSIANILNGVASESYYTDTKKSYVKFTAPGATALVVDDVNTNLHVTKGLLAYYEIDAKLCNNGFDAIEALKAKDYDLVFMDHMMPGMDGIEATAHIRAMGEQNPYYKDLPIIVLTANAISGVKEMFLANGFNDFLSKPIEMAQLNSVLEKWVPKAKQKISSPKSIEKGIPEAKIDEMGEEPIQLKIDGLDVRRGIAKTGDSIENYIQMLNVFQQEWLKNIYAIKTAFEANDFDLFITYIHALKNAASRIGAAKLSKSASSLENAVNKMDIAFAQAHLDDLFSQVHAAIASIRGALKNDRSDGNRSFDASRLRAGLAALQLALKRRDSAAISSAAKEILSFLHVPGIGSTLENMLRCAMSGEYDEALSMANFLLQEKE